MPLNSAADAAGQEGEQARPSGPGGPAGAENCTVALEANPPKRRAIRAQIPGRPGWPDEPSSSSCPAARFRVRWLPGPSGVILIAACWYLRYGLSYRDLEELLAERGIEVGHVTLFRWVQRFTPVLVDASRPCRHSTGGRWFVDENYVKVSGCWRYIYRAVDQYGQVIDVFVSKRRDIKAAPQFFPGAIGAHGTPLSLIHI